MDVESTYEQAKKERQVGMRRRQKRDESEIAFIKYFEKVIDILLDS